MIQKIRYFFSRFHDIIVDVRDIVMTDIPHHEIADVMQIKSTSGLLKNLNKDITGHPIQKLLIFSMAWFFYQFVKYKVWRYKRKYPEYLL